ncbi:ABC transporter ATP-binding protein [Roseovarius aestuariivivens]|uniref:ABC transporter ATP-binding protein n=1 Tax=Roseovarius aestuariivivens TaxID=1888910 RepID=UPI0010808B1F|nr:ABC transporter ATP-binding protein [Roseovarius aestuariivivens]
MLDQPLARFENLRVSFGRSGQMVTGVEDLSVDIRAGETVCLVGESGSGKSVSALALMRLIGFDGGDISGGRILFDRGNGQETDLAKLSAEEMRKIRGNQIGMIFQEPMTALNPVLTVERQLTEGLRQHLGLSRSRARARALDLLRQVRLPEPERRLRQFPHELSGGQRQRVVIAMALACHPRLLIADEPTTALDVTIQAEILALLDRLRRETGAAVLFITHDMAVVAQIADRVVVMQNGRKVEEGPVARIFADPRHDYTKRLLAAVPRLGEMRDKRWPEPFAKIGAAPPIPVRGTDTPLLTVEGLCTRFAVRGGVFRRRIAQVHAVEDVSFTLNRGRTLALVGESGCGKSTVGRSILRLVDPSAGRITLDGTDLAALGPAALRRARAGMQMVFQDPFGSLNPQMCLRDQVTEPLRNFSRGTRATREAKAAALFARAGLPESYLDRYPHALSGGQRQRVAIARALALDPALIVADEAVSALDVSVQAQVLNLLLELQAELGLSYLFISHDMAVVERMAHDVAVMYLGRIVEIGPRASVLYDPRHPYTKALLRAVPVADPGQRPGEKVLNFRPNPSPIHPIGHVPVPSAYQEVAPGHHVLITDCGY